MLGPFRVEKVPSFYSHAWEQLRAAGLNPGRRLESPATLGSLLSSPPRLIDFQLDSLSLEPIWRPGPRTVLSSHVLNAPVNPSAVGVQVELQGCGDRGGR